MVTVGIKWTAQQDMFGGFYGSFITWAESGFKWNDTVSPL